MKRSFFNAETFLFDDEWYLPRDYKERRRRLSSSITKSTYRRSRRRSA